MASPPQAFFARNLVKKGTLFRGERQTPEIAMKLFTCQVCSQLLYFENVRCEHCGHTLGYIPDIAQISALEPLENGAWKALAAPAVPYKFCKNTQFGVCNWMVRESD